MCRDTGRGMGDLEGFKRMASPVKTACMHSASSEPTMTSVVRFKCPGCENTYKDTAGLQHSRRASNSNTSTGIINHLKTAGHPNSPDVITRENTRVEGVLVGGKFVRKEQQVLAAASHSSNAPSLEEVRSSQHSTYHT